MNETLENIEGRSRRLSPCSDRDFFPVFIFIDGTAENALVAEVYLELRRTRQRTLDDRFRQRILDVLLQRSPQRPCAVGPVGVLLEYVASRFVREPDPDLLCDEI